MAQLDGAIGTGLCRPCRLEDVRRVWLHSMKYMELLDEPGHYVVLCDVCERTWSIPTDRLTREEEVWLSLISLR